MRAVGVAALVIALSGCNDDPNSLVPYVLKTEHVACRDAEYARLLTRTYGEKPQDYERLVQSGIMNNRCRIFPRGSEEYVKFNQYSGRMENIAHDNTLYYVFDSIND